MGIQRDRIPFLIKSNWIVSHEVDHYFQWWNWSLFILKLAKSLKFIQISHWRLKLSDFQLTIAQTSFIGYVENKNWTKIISKRQLNFFSQLFRQFSWLTYMILINYWAADWYLDVAIHKRWLQNLLYILIQYSWNSGFGLPKICLVKWKFKWFSSKKKTYS